MKYLLISAVVAWLITVYAYHYAQGQGDNFGAIFVPMVALLVSAIMTAIYFACAIWLHRLW